MQPTYYRPTPVPRPIRRSPEPPVQQRSRRPLLFAAVVIVFFGLLWVFNHHSAADSPAIKSAVGNFCLDALDNHAEAGTPVNGRPCRSNAAQAWTLGVTYIKHGTDGCLSIEDNATKADSPVVLAPCGQEPGQVWLKDQGGLFNPNSGKCLTLSSSKPTAQLTIDACNLPGSGQQVWQSSGTNINTLTDPCKGTTKGQRIACFAEQEWGTWQSGRSSHQALLNSYTGGASYEAWCADFVSYVYREAGFAFTKGENNHWNENDSHKIQYMGFTKHDPDNYTPKPGDVAYFNYPGGHVEIVVAGGKQPTFIYGNSGEVDPATGNGDMKANTVTKDGSIGQLEYYLSPNNI